MFGKKYEYLVEIKGMKCSNCALHVKDAIKKIEGVKKVEVDLQTNTAAITSKVELDTKIIKNNIENLDYSVINIKMI